MRVASYLIRFNKHKLTLLNAITCTQLRKKYMYTKTQTSINCSTDTCTRQTFIVTLCKRIFQLSSAVSEICTQ